MKVKNKSRLKDSLQKVWDKLRRKKKLSKPERSRKRFLELYPKYELGRHTYGLPHVQYWDDDARLRIGSYCSIARNVEILLGGHHRTDWVSSYPFPAFFKEASHIESYAISRGDVIIENDVWLCTNCIILSGITIGNGAVVASGAVVTRDVEPYAIVAGNPARVIRYRFDEPTRRALLETAWWDWPEEELKQVMDKLCSDKVNDFLDYAQRRNRRVS